MLFYVVKTFCYNGMPMWPVPKPSTLKHAQQHAGVQEVTESDELTQDSDVTDSGHGSLEPISRRASHVGASKPKPPLVSQTSMHKSRKSTQLLGMLLACDSDTVFMSRSFSWRV